MGGICQLRHFSVGPDRPRQLAWEREMTSCKQMETVIIPTSLYKKNPELIICKMKDASPDCMIRIEIAWNQQRNLYNSQSNHVPLQNFQHCGSRCDHHFPSKFCDLKVWSDVYFTQNCFRSMYVGIIYLIIKISFYCVIPFWEYRGIRLEGPEDRHLRNSSFGGHVTSLTLQYLWPRPPGVWLGGPGCKPGHSRRS